MWPNNKCVVTFKSASGPTAVFFTVAAVAASVAAAVAAAIICIAAVAAGW